ncbi:class I SAM-dependent methyltransferase [Corallococcus sp. AB049A]|uniref:Class I SAM-dependent methyltransferase n=1 Tax=Corallococcus interemptor TaxID=2316720 RepID=A0A3A8Q689_9BACT|nr:MULTISPECIES: class I SAM-dependent methyltransferase [Corallococcus]RKH49442.1 class I SAM-dependent methyltransferase [Corallococcus sp. AB050B]RKH63021.1 class I SAM-dependent methyltransferase [Corallococcus interemptor]RKI70325.1 class I SAM-dependent methyltransferase [Corallococcus sp. AB049A]
MKPLSALIPMVSSPLARGRDANEAVAPAPLTPFDVRTYHEALAARGLARQGPGPRVYGHTGLVDRLPPPGTPGPELRECLRRSQEALLAELARAMGPFPDGGEVLDVGSVLGGSALYWAQEHRARVTALLAVPSHLEQVRRFAHEAGLGAHVQARLCTGEPPRPRECYDAVIAVENTCALPRAEWLRGVHARLKPGGVLAVADCFWVRANAMHPSEDAWSRHLGSVNAFLADAHEAGLELEAHDDVSARAVGFWTLSSELRVHEHLARAPEDARGLRAALNAVRAESRREHLWLQQGLLDGGLEYALLVLRREG